MNAGTMGPLAKVAVTVAGYALALLVASAVVAVYVLWTSGPDRDASGGMHAFGDGLLFLAVFSIASIPPTAAALFFLRTYRVFWIALLLAASAVVASGLAALAVYLGARAADPGSILHQWDALAVLRILVAPAFALAFLVAGVLAPARASRVGLLVAATSEAGVFATVLLIWLTALRPF
ncbi:hypothetical protein [Accumulibacter sp.]|uniref:hypothetical protein n=1 Tax=Accumulibacter sp. TaxID=2053492 RepID=UPI0025FB20C1|nr:hypothetical protein [Accumulibacter sp.]MCM8595958.1 hypothetical protein [Accumulibacter sp.]MCM8625216.1 hypothetical protein [Accumulibacter sp.]MDS4050107.1 hypothetical protein [Accumulibacter sp.]